MRSKQKQTKRGSSKLQINKGESLLNRKIIAPQKLKILVLAGNDLLNQHLDFLSKCTNLIKLDLSHNHISKISQKINFGNLFKLEVIYLHQNKIGSLEAIRPIYKCNSLVYFTYHHNALEVLVKNEHQIVNSMPNLKLINNRIICIEERAQYLMHERTPVFADIQMLQNWKSTQNSEAYYIRVLNMQLQYIDNLWAFNNPIIIIQRAWKHFMPYFQEQQEAAPSSHRSRSIASKLLQRKATSRNKGTSRVESKSPHPLKTFFQEWKNFSSGLSQVKKSMKKCNKEGNKVDKGFMMLPLLEYKKELRNKKVTDPLNAYISHVRQTIYQKRMVQKFITNIKMKKVLFQNDLSFYDISGIKDNNRLFFNKSQQHIIQNFLDHIAENFNKRQIIYDKSKMGLAPQFNAIRLVEPESFANKYSSRKNYSLCSLIWPSTKVIVTKKKTVVNKTKSGFIGIPQLTYLKNRDKVLTEKEYTKSVDTYRRLLKFALNEYETNMCYFYCQDEFVMKHLLRMIYYHNAGALKFKTMKKTSSIMSILQNYEEPFIFYVDKVIARTCAAVTIQKTWRRYISNKHQAQSIYNKMKKNRAALHIQRFFRDSIYRHRQLFSKKLIADLALLKTNIIIYPLSFYMSLSQIFNNKPQSILFKDITITRNGKEIGINQEFFRSIYQEKIRNKYFEERTLGKQNHPHEVDLYNIFHYNVDNALIDRNGVKFISLSYSTNSEANIVASIVALLTYQLWGSYYVWPLTKQNPFWESTINEYLNIKKVRQFMPKFKQQPQNKISMVKKQMEEHGVFMWCPDNNINLNQLQLPTFKINVQFYQKKYHDFPMKQTGTLIYTIFNEDTQASPVEDNKQIEIEAAQKKFSQTQQVRNDGPLNVTMIDKKKFSFFDQSDKTIRHSQPETPLMGKTQPLLMTKKDKVKQFYRQEVVKRQAQKQIKETALSGIRDRVKQEKTLNTTLRNLKEAERAESLRNKVQRIKEFKARASSKREEEDFIQQNNFVMEQQLKMVIMRGRMKDSQAKRQEFLTKKSSFDHHSTKRVPSIPSRKSSRQKARVEIEESRAEISLAQTLGQQGSVVNQRRTKRSRGHSIGAYMRDPSFVHGVFPQEYYPIESRGTSFYFPPVV